MATWIFYNKFKQYQFDGTAPVDFDNDTVKVALVTNAYTPDIDAHDYWDDVSANELAAGDGYTAGGATIANPTFTLDTANDQVKFDMDDITWTFTATKSFRYAVMYKDTGVASTSVLIAYADLGDTSLDGTFTLQMDADGVFIIS